MRFSIKPRKLYLRLALVLPILLFGLASTVSSPIPVETSKPFSQLIEAHPSNRALKNWNQDKLPLHFIENQGQLHNQISYYVKGRNTSFYFDPRGITINTTRIEDDAAYTGQAFSANFIRPIAYKKKTDYRDSGQRGVLKLDFVDANPGVRPQGKDRTSTVINYFKGPRSRWRMGLASYSALVYENLWPGIDLLYTGNANGLKYTFVVKPGADPGRIKLRCRGAGSMSINPNGQLEADTPAGIIRDDKPYSYQDQGGQPVEVATEYDLKREAGDYVYGFSVGDYDKEKVLMIDPVVLLYCGYVGGSEFELGSFGGLALDNEGSAYIVGDTESDETTFPVTAGPDLTFNGGDTDVFIAKVNPSGTELVYCGYIGGAEDECGYDIAVDGEGNAYIFGDTNSNESTFPVRVGPDLSYNAGFADLDAFVAKVNAQGTDLVYCGYVGGSGADFAGSIAVDSAGNAYVLGETDSDETTFPVSVGPDLTYNGRVDAYIAKVNITGTALDYCGYIGGAEFDSAFEGGVAVDSAGNAYVLGNTDSTRATFPVRVGPDLKQNGETDAFVAKIAFDQGLLLRFETPVIRIRRGHDMDIRIEIERDEGVSNRVTITPPDTSAIGVRVRPSSPVTGSGRKIKFIIKVKKSAAPGIHQLIFTGRDQSGNESARTLTLIVR